MGKKNFWILAGCILMTGALLGSSLLGCSRKSGAPEGQVTIKVSIWGTPEEIDIINKVVKINTQIEIFFKINTNFEFQIINF